jgi:hypothetical protein
LASITSVKLTMVVTSAIAAVFALAVKRVTRTCQPVVAGGRSMRALRWYAVVVLPLKLLVSTAA